MQLDRACRLRWFGTTVTVTVIFSNNHNPAHHNPGDNHEPTGSRGTRR
jgi:hypothetical protein